MRLAGGPELLLDAEVELDPAAPEPAATPGSKRFGLLDLGETERAGIELPRLVFPARRHGELNVIESP